MSNTVGESRPQVRSQAPAAGVNGKVTLLATFGILSELPDEGYAKALHTVYCSVPLLAPV